jgi:hypothetical protein
MFFIAAGDGLVPSLSEGLSVEEIEVFSVEFDGGSAYVMDLELKIVD